MGDRWRVIALHLLTETSAFEAIAKRDISSLQPERHRDIGVVRCEWDEAWRPGKWMPHEETMSPATNHDDVRQIGLQGIDETLKIGRDSVARHHPP
jgi:hypothetical protein